MDEAALRAAVVDVARRMEARGLNRGTSGNASARRAGGFLVTPSAVPCRAMAPEDVVLVGGKGEAPAGQRRPSSEWRMHARLYEARPQVGAVVHAHPPFATALACLRRGIPAFHYMVAVAGGDSIRCADYATFGTADLADAALRAMEGRRACLLANHGMLAVGADLEEALALAVEVEVLAEQYVRALEVGEPVLLPADEMARVLARFADYRRA